MPDLLHADEEQIDRAALAAALGPAFILAVCPVDLRLRALAYLRGHLNGLTVPEPQNVTTPDEMLTVLDEQVQLDKRVLSVTLENADAAVFDTLNLHREKVLKGGPMVLWLDDVEALRALRERAPDAYSFRTALLLLQGDGGALPQANAEESDELVRARNRFARASDPFARAVDAVKLADELSLAGKHKEAVRVAESALATFPTAITEEGKIIRARLCRTLSSTELVQGRDSRSLRWSRQAMMELSGLESPDAMAARVELLALWAGPEIWGGKARSRIREAQSTAARARVRGATRYMLVYWSARMAILLGDLSAARSQMNAFSALPSPNEAEGIYWKGLLDSLFQARRGDVVQAETKYRAMAEHASKNGFVPTLANELALRCLFWRGELNAAERQIMHSALTPRRSAFWLNTIAFMRGDVSSSMAKIRTMLLDATRAANEGDILSAVESMTTTAMVANDAARLSRTTITSILADLDVAYDVIMQLSGPDGPEWYPIELNTYRAQLLYLAEKQDEALVLLRQTLQLARSTYPDLLPETARVLTNTLIESNLFQEALDVIADVEPIALERGFLETRGQLLANRILVLVGKNITADELAQHITAFHAALDATDSKRITAEGLLNLAKRLPNTTTFPDPLELADKAHRLFVAMPMPVEEARCLEVLGDVLAARGLRIEAKSRYLNARARLERHECLLRIPLLEGKLQAT